MLICSKILFSVEISQILGCSSFLHHCLRPLDTPPPHTATSLSSCLFPFRLVHSSFLNLVFVTCSSLFRAFCSCFSYCPSNRAPFDRLAPLSQIFLLVILRFSSSFQKFDPAGSTAVRLGSHLFKFSSLPNRLFRAARFLPMSQLCQILLYVRCDSLFQAGSLRLANHFPRLYNKHTFK